MDATGGMFNFNVCIDTTSPNQDTTRPGAKQLAFWTHGRNLIVILLIQLCGR